MPSLPTQGGNTGTWGTDLNAFLSVSLDSAGAVKSTSAYIPGGTDVPVADGGTGSSTAAAARTALGISTELLSSSTLGSPAANFDITSISGAYNHLRLMVIGATSDGAAQVMKMTFNNDGTSIYDWQEIVSNSTTASAAEVFASAFLRVGVLPPSTFTNGFGISIIDIPFYTNTAFHKAANATYPYFTSTSAAGNNWRSTGCKYRSTTAISRITCTPTAGNFITGSAYTLHGIL